MVFGIFFIFFSLRFLILFGLPQLLFIEFDNGFYLFFFLNVSFYVGCECRCVRKKKKNRKRESNPLQFSRISFFINCMSIISKKKWCRNEKLSLPVFVCGFFFYFKPKRIKMMVATLLNFQIVDEDENSKKKRKEKAHLK